VAEGLLMGLIIPPDVLVARKESDECWIPPGRSIRVAGYDLPVGMIYVGPQLSSLRDVHHADPALIDPRLPIDRTRPDRTGLGMFRRFWPSYSHIPEPCRAAYLEWLADGRQDPRACIGYVFLFFYGIERRVLFDTEYSFQARGEIRGLISEVRQLLDLYGRDRSFGTYAPRFVRFATSLARCLDEPTGGDHTVGLELAVASRTGLEGKAERLPLLSGYEPASATFGKHGLVGPCRLPRVAGPGERAATEPPTVRSADQVQDFAIPRPEPVRSKPTVALDMVRVAEVSADSREATQLLARVLDPASPNETIVGVSGREASPSPIESRGLRHSPLFRTIVERRTWSIGEFGTLVKEFGLLPLGAIETFNEVAFDVCGEPMLEGQDPIEVNPYAVEMMLS
jgi:hypothetical protein